MPKAPEAKLYGREFQHQNATAAKPSSGWLRKIMSGQKPPEQKLYTAPFHRKTGG